MKKLLMTLALFTLGFNAISAEISRDNLKVNGVSRTLERGAVAQWGNSTFIIFNDQSWLPGSCTSADAVRISSNDEIMISIALKAIETGNSVFARINSGRVTGGYCELVQLTVKNQ